MGQERDDLEAYRTQVAIELERRIDRVRQLDGAIASVDFRLDAGGGPAQRLNGPTSRVLAGRAFREKLKRDRTKLERERNEAVEDVKRAQERLEQVDGELAELVTDSPMLDEHNSGGD